MTDDDVTMLPRQLASDLLRRMSHRKAFADAAPQSRLARQFKAAVPPPPALSQLLSQYIGSTNGTSATSAASFSSTTSSTSSTSSSASSIASMSESDLTTAFQQLAASLTLISEDEPLIAALNSFETAYSTALTRVMLDRLAAIVPG